MTVRAPIEYRRASVTAVDFDERIVTMIAAPYEEEAMVEYRGEIWHESFLRGAWAGLEQVPNRVRVNRDHDHTRTVGKAVRFDPDHDVGLLSEVRIAATVLGDETLTLADEDMLGVSVGFAVRGADQDLDRPYRRIRRAFMDHLAFVEQPAYESARVLSVRGQEGDRLSGPDAPTLHTPNLDEVLAWRRARNL